MMRPLEFGWYLPTHGDTTAIGDPAASVDSSTGMLLDIIRAAEESGFEYILIPITPTCWEAYVTGAYMVGQTKTIRPLIAARPGYINPVLLAKMIATFDQLTGGRIAVNLIAGQSEAEIISDGILYAKEDRYALMDEEVSIMKALWATGGPVDHAGRFHTLQGARIVPGIFQQPHPPFYLGGGSAEAAALSAKHSDVHLFWGDTPERIAQNIAHIRDLADTHGRRDAIGFGMRLQIICRETEAEAWAAARALVAAGSERSRARIRRDTANSAANRRVQELAETQGEMIGPALWTGVSQVRAGAGIAVVGNPEQCAAQLQEFIEAGCHSFCLSGYLHAAEARRFKQLVRPLLASRNAGRMVA
jgi:alkanesulfonate monooxygenase